MAATLTIPTIFTGVDRISAVVERMKKSVGGFAGKVEGSVLRADRWFNKLTPSIGNTTKQLFRFASSAALAGSIIAGITFSAKSIMDYEVALHSLQAVTGTSYKLFTGQIESIAKRTRKSSIDVAGAFEVIGSAMSQYLQDPKALGQIAEAGITLSKASRDELVPTLDNLTNIMNQFKLSSGQAEYAINRLTAGEIVGSMRTSEVASALQEFGASAKLANVNLGESVALVEVLGRQMKHAEVGNAAKNIMVILQAAKGLQKRARRELLKNKVNLGMLMDNKIPLGDRLTELSKILKDPIAMVKVFGRENLTAGQVILSNLKTYKDWAHEIDVTNKAHEQAAVNADTLANRIAELKNSWVTYITTNSSATVGLNRVKNAIKYVTDNLDTIIDVTVTAIKWFVGIKVAIFAVRTAMLLWNAANLLFAGSGAVVTAAVASETIVVEGFGGAIAGVTTEMAAANIAATSFFGTLSGFVLPAALVALSGLAFWKEVDKGNKMLPLLDGYKPEYFNTKTATGKISPFQDFKEEKAYQDWFLKQANSGVSMSHLERADFRKQFGTKFQFFNPAVLDSVLNNKNNTPVLNRPGALTGNGGNSASGNNRVDIYINDPAGNVSKIDTSKLKGNIKVTPTSGVR